MSLNLELVNKVMVRLEGDVNRNWTLILKDGKELKYYSIEGSPQSEMDDSRVYDYDPKLADFLDKCSFELKPDNWGPSDDSIVEYTIDFERQLIYDYSDEPNGPQCGVGGLFPFNRVTMQRNEHSSSLNFKKLDLSDPKVMVLRMQGEGADEMMSFLFEFFRADCIKYLEANGHTDTDWNDYEGGIDEWWGFGSVFLYELGMRVKWEASDEGTVLTLS